MNTLPPEISAALVALALAALVGLTEIVRRLVKVAIAKLEANTVITKQVATQTNGQIVEARQQAAKYRILAERYRWILREVNADAEGRAVVDRVMQKHRTVVHDADFEALERRLTEAPSYD
jgi:hypothetical protein